MARVTKEEKYERTKKRFAQAERGTGGLKKVRLFDFYELPGMKQLEVINEPYILTCNDEETVVVMTIEDYFALKGHNPNPSRRPLLMRKDGILFMEIV